jgi:hypothetical protein
MRTASKVFPASLEPSKSRWTAAAGIYPARSRHRPAIGRISFALTLLLWPGLTWAAEVDANSGLTFLQTPEGAKRLTIALAVRESPAAGPQGYLVQRSAQPLDELSSVPPSIASTYVGKDFSAYQIATLPDGTRYVVALNEEKTVKFLNRNDATPWYARIYRIAGEKDAKPELLREGLQMPGNDVTIPVELPLPGIGTTKVKALRTEIGYGLNGFQNSKPQVFSGRGPTLQVSGGQVTPEGKLTLTLTVPDALTVQPETQAILQFQPLRPGLPEHTATGKVTDFLTLGAARFIVTAVAPDFSSATLAIVAGSLEETLKQELEAGAHMPPFSQVDLITRKTVTREELLTRARTTAGVVFVFGDLPSAGSHSRMGPPSYGPYGRPESMVLPLPCAEVVEQLGIEMNPKPLVVLVTRQIGIDFLYDELRNKTPDYVVLTDFADPLRTGFRLPQNMPGGGWYGPPSYPGSEEESLRQLFNLPGNTISVAVFDREGTVLYVKPEASRGFLPTLAEARAALGQKGKAVPKRARDT